MLQSDLKKKNSSLSRKFPDELVDSMRPLKKENHWKTVENEIFTNVSQVFLWRTMCTNDFKFMQMIKCCDRLLPEFWLVKRHVILVGS